MSALVIAGVFVGGASRRMGGVAKGTLAAPSHAGTLVDRWLDVLEDCAVRHVVLVGRREAYASLGLATLDDEPPGIGPLGGLAALLRYACASGRPPAGPCRALALACDMPFVSPSLVGRLLTTPTGAPALAPRRDGRWEPLCAVYDAALAYPIVLRRIARGGHALQALLDEARADELPLSAAEANELRDWDRPADMP